MNLGIDGHKIDLGPKPRCWTFYFVGLVAVTLCVFYFYKLWHFHPRVPMSYQGDVNAFMAQIRNIRLEGSIYRSPLLGFPYGQDLHDTIAPGEVAYQILLWVLTRFISSEAMIVNGIFLCSYLLIYSSTFFAARLLRLSPFASLLSASLFAFVPYHFQRGVSHLYLANYFIVAPIVALCIRQLSISPLIADFGDIRKLSSFMSWLKNRGTQIALVIAVAAATTSMYYSVASVMLILSSSLLGSISLKRIGRLISGLFLSGIMALFLIIQFLPIVLFQRENGNNLSVVSRSLAGVETYSLKLTALLTPIINHRIPFLADFSLKSTEVPLRTEYTGSLGIVGSIVLVTLIFIFLLQSVTRDKSKFSSFSLLVMIALLFGTTGGIAQFIAQFGFTQLRAWNRISIFIACIVFLAFGLFVDEFKKRVKHQGILSFFAVIIVFLSFFDMNPTALAPNFEVTTAKWTNDQRLVERIENRFGSNAKIFQLPVIPYPEYPPVVRMTDYDHMRGYLHSTTLHWSYGGVKGRESEWQTRLPSIPDEKMLGCLKSKGFNAIWLDTFGYSEPSQVTEALRTGKAYLEFSDDQQRVMIFDLSKLESQPEGCP